MTDNVLQFPTKEDRFWDGLKRRFLPTLLRGIPVGQQTAYRSCDLLRERLENWAYGDPIRLPAMAPEMEEQVKVALREHNTRWTAFALCLALEVYWLAGEQAFRKQEEAPLAPR